jgi:hypothetical protein
MASATRLFSRGAMKNMSASLCKATVKDIRMNSESAEAPAVQRYQ